MIEKALNRKMRARYLGPCIVISKNRGSAYIIAKLDGAVFDQPVAAFHMIPYFTQSNITFPNLGELIDISQAQLTQMEDTTPVDPEEDDGNENLTSHELLDDD